MASGGHRQPFSSVVYAKLRAGATKFIPQGFQVLHYGLRKVILGEALKQAWNGTCFPNPVIVLSSNGTTWSMTLTGEGTTDLECIFGSVAYIFDTTPAVSINLTAGTDTAPQANFVYLTESGGTISINASTSGYPLTAHLRIGDFLLQSAASGQTHGEYLSHQHSEHLGSADGGAIVHHSEKLRELGATWFSGVAAANMVVSAPDAYLSVATGVVHQLHAHTFPALDMQTPTTFYVVNDPTTPFKPITSLDDITQDAAGNTINNKHFSLVLWGSMNANGAAQCYINLPGGTYSTAAKAARDAEKHTVFLIPTDFKGTGFLIVEYRVEGKTSGTWVQNDLIDLRGSPQPISPGGGPGITSHTDLANLTPGDGGHTDLLTRADAGGLKHVIKEIVNWDMDAGDGIGVAHGLTLADIRTVEIIIYDDAETVAFTMAGGSGSSAVGEPQAWVAGINATTITLRRLTGGRFDHTDFDATGGFVRGFLTIGHV